MDDEPGAGGDDGIVDLVLSGTGLLRHRTTGETGGYAEGPDREGPGLRDSDGS